MSNPSITGVSYNASTGVLTVGGANLVASVKISDLYLYGASINSLTGAISASFKLTASDTLSNFSASGFSVTLSNTDRISAAKLFPDSGVGYGNTVSSNLDAQIIYSSSYYGYQLYATSGWEGSGSLPVYYNQGLQVSFADSASGYKTSYNLNDNASLKPFADLKLGDNSSTDNVGATISLGAANGALSGAGLSVATVASGTATYTLAATTPASLAQELDKLVFTPTLHQVAGGSSVNSTLALNISGANSSLTEISISQTDTVNSTAPGLKAVAYNAVSGTFTVTGVNLGTRMANLNLADFSVSAAGKSYTLTGSGDSISHLSDTGFSLSLGSAEHSAVDAIFSNNGTGSRTAAYTLAGAAGWDGVGSLAASAKVTASYLSLGLSGLTTSATLSDTATINPFKNLLLADSNSAGSDSATISFTSANGNLSGSGLSGSDGSYSLMATTAAQLQNELHSLLFTPTVREANVGSSTGTNFTLSISDNSTAFGSSATLDTLSNSTTEVSVSGSQPAAALTGSSYNALSGVLQVNGSGLTSSLVLGDLMLSNGSSRYTLAAGSDKVTASSGGDFIVQLGAAGESAVNALFAASNGNNAGQYSLQATSGWDGAYTLAGSSSVTVSHSSFSLSGLAAQTVNDFAGIKPFAGLTLTDSVTETLTARISYAAALGVLSGTGLSGGNGNYTLSAASAAALQTGLQQLQFSPALPLPADRTTIAAPITLSVTGSANALDNTLLTPLKEQLSIKLNTVDPTLSTVSYDAHSGVLTLSGGNLAKGVLLSDISLQAGSSSYTLSGVGDSVSNLTAKGFTLTLGSTDQAAVNALFPLYGSGDSASPYSLATTSNWDGSGSTANSGIAVLVSGSNSMAVSGLTAAEISDTSQLSPFANLGFADTNVTQSDSVTISFTGGDGVLSGSGLSAATVSGGTTSYSLAATTAAQLQTELANLTFTPTQGLSATTDFKLNFTGTIDTPVNHPALSISKGINNPVAVAVNASGEIFVANNNDPTGALHNGSLTAYSATGAVLFNISRGVSLPSSLAVDAAGNVYVANSNTDKYGDGSVAEYSASGALLQTFTGLSNVQSVVVDSQGDVFVACLTGNINSTGYVAEFSAAGVLQRVISSGINTPDSLALDSSGDLYVANFAANTVKEYSATGSLLQSFSAGVENPSSVAVDSYGDVYVCNNPGNNDGNVQEFSAGGSLLYTDTNSFQNPVALAVDSHGDVFVADEDNHTVSEFSNGGVLLATLSTGISNVVSLSVDSRGDVYVASQLGNSVEKFTPVVNNSYFTDQYTASVSLSVTAAATAFSVAPNSNVSNLTVITGALSGDKLTLADAGSFNATALTGSAVTASGGDVAQLSAWVTAALSSSGGNLAQHGIEWFTFNNNTYLLEQANAKGTAYGSGDTLVELVGVHDESQAGFNAATHMLTL